MCSGLTTTDFDNNEDHHYWSAASVDTLDGSVVLYQSSWNDNRHYVCQFDCELRVYSLHSNTSSHLKNFYYFSEQAFITRWIVYDLSTCSPTTIAK